MLKRSASTSPTVRSLTISPTTWSTGRGKGGKKLGVGGGLVKNHPKKGFKEWSKWLSFQPEPVEETQRGQPQQKFEQFG